MYDENTYVQKMKVVKTGILNKHSSFVPYYGILETQSVFLCFVLLNATWSELNSTIPSMIIFEIVLQSFYFYTLFWTYESCNISIFRDYIMSNFQDHS